MDCCFRTAHFSLAELTIGVIGVIGVTLALVRAGGIAR
jgi:hypothetical protein